MTQAQAWKCIHIICLAVSCWIGMHIASQVAVTQVKESQMLDPKNMYHHKQLQLGIHQYVKMFFQFYIFEDLYIWES